MRFRILSTLILLPVIAWAWLAHVSPSNFLRWAVLVTLCG